MQSRQAVLAQFIFGGSALLLAFDTPLAELDGAPDDETKREEVWMTERFLKDSFCMLSSQVSAMAQIWIVQTFFLPRQLEAKHSECQWNIHIGYMNTIAIQSTMSWVYPRHWAFHCSDFQLCQA